MATLGNHVMDNVQEADQIHATEKALVTQHLENAHVLKGLIKVQIVRTAEMDG
jgi:hypothetical protein